MICPNCGIHNEDNYKFCMKCGQALQEEVEERPSPKPISAADTPQQPTTAPSPSFDVPEAQMEASQQESPASQTKASPYTPAQTTIPYGEGELSALNIWGPFAGYGTRRRHVGWLMNGEGEHCKELISTVETKFGEREIPGANLTRPTLVAKGVLVERRPYFLLQQGLATLALYIASFGRDLFVSMASYLKPPISNFRVLVLLCMSLFGIYMVFGYPSSLANSLENFLGGINLFGSSEASSGNLFSLLCLIGPIGMINNLALFLFVCFSLYKWLKEKDIWAGLRVPPNEFNEDDLMAMEKAVEETVRQSLTELKLNPDDLKLATIGRGGQLF